MNTSGTRALNNQMCLRIARELRRGSLGFNAIERAVKARLAPELSSRLKAMIRDGLITREVLSLGPPASTRYSLTALGRQLAEPATTLIDFIDTHVDEVEISRAKYVASSAT
jgi:DNA-binding HxlR family transcriptional regulator